MYRWFLLPALKFIIQTIQLDTCVCALYVMRFTKHLSRPQLGSKKMASNWQFVLFWQCYCQYLTAYKCIYDTWNKASSCLLWICKYKQGRGLLIIARDTLYYNEFRKEKIDYFLNQWPEVCVRVQIKYGKVYKVGQDFVGFFQSDDTFILKLRNELWHIFCKLRNEWQLLRCFISVQI